MAYLSRSEAARRLNRCRKTMRSLEAQGLGPRTIKIGSRTVYPIADLEAYIAAGGDR
ncbi:helix-turn-helix transcriptional regulator [Rhodopseudomonas sp.]|uniref:helix-turn-helix transcriptional regulator n=1 Tax=Rhodopseudomonas sp. TaxID=1078 RepID=UPI003B3B6CF0